MAANFYRSADKPRYILGHALSMGFVVAGISAASILITGYYLSNKKRTRALKSGERSRFVEAELSAQGDKAITWRYMY